MNEWLRSVKRFVDRAVFLLLRILFRPRGGVKTLLIVRTDGIGDLVFFLPFVLHLKTHFVDHRIILVCRREAAPLAGEDIVDACIPFDYMKYRWNYFYRVMVLLKIRSVRPSTTIYTSYHRQHIGDEMAVLSGAQRVIAFDGNDEIIHPAMRESNDRFYSKIVQVEDHVPEMEKYGALFASMGISTDGVENARRRLAGRGAHDKNDADSYVLLAPGGSSPLRRWPWKQFAELGDMIAERTGLEVVLCGSREEERLLAKIKQEMKKKPVVKSDMPIQSVIGLIEHASMVVGNESGLLHIAASVGTPAICILGGGHFSRYFPYGSAKIVNHTMDCYECNWKCPFPEVYCLTRISASDVMREIERFLTYPAIESPPSLDKRRGMGG